jgi:4-amino-4-deoxy-L-arabinose transferase-like glycosyltransferase
MTEPSIVPTAAAAFLGLLFVCGFFGFRKPEERNFLLPLAIVAFVLRAGLVPIYYLILVDAGLQGFEFEDSIKYHYRGIEFAKELARGIDYSSEAWRTVDPGYPLLTGFVYWMTGVNTLVMRMLNCVISVVTLLWVYRMAKLAFDDDRVARWACYLLAFLPYPILFVVTHRKDVLVAALATFVFYQGLRMLRFENDVVKATAWMFGALACISFFRSGFIFPFLSALFVCYAVTQRSLAQALALSIPSIAILLLAQVFISGDSSLSLAANAGRFEAKLIQSGNLADGAGLVSLVRMTSFFEIYKLPFAVPLALILPFPPSTEGSLPAVMLSFANLGNLVVLPHVLVGAVMTFARGEWKRRVPLLIFAGSFIVLLAAVHIGIIRYRETIYPTVLVLAGAGLARGNNGLISAVVYFGLVMLGGVVLFVRNY